MAKPASGHNSSALALCQTMLALRNASIFYRIQYYDRRPRDEKCFNQEGQHVAGDQTNIAGDVYAADIAYDVSGLPENPYLGLKAFTYKDRDRFAGRRNSVQQVLHAISATPEPPALFFIVGASGSGKSSFAQAGLIPELEEHFLGRGKSVACAVFQPGQFPMNALAEALCELGLSPNGGAGTGRTLYVLCPRVCC